MAKSNFVIFILLYKNVPETVFHKLTAKSLPYKKIVVF